MKAETNGNGLTESTLTCKVPKMKCKGWHDKNSMINATSLADMADDYEVTMDTSKDKAMFVHLLDKIVCFGQMKNQLHGLSLKDPKRHVTQDQHNKIMNNDNRIQMNDNSSAQTTSRVQFAGVVKQDMKVDAVKNNLKFLSTTQRKKAKASRKMMQALGTPTSADLKALTRVNMIRNCSVNTEDVNLADRACGRDVSIVEGKSARSSPKQINSNLIELPEELLSVQEDDTTSMDRLEVNTIKLELLSVQEDVAISMDGLEVNTIKFLTSVSHDLHYRTSQAVGRKPDSSVFADKLKEIELCYRNGSFRLNETHADLQFKKSLKEFCGLCDPPIKHNLASTGAHVPRAERNNRLIKERIRAAHHQLPCDRLPKLLLTHLVMQETVKLNYFPAKHGVSKYFSPRMIVHRENLDCERHYLFVTVECVQGNHDPLHMSTTEARTSDCLYLRLAAKSQDSHELLHLATNCVVTCRTETPCLLLTQSLNK